MSVVLPVSDFSKAKITDFETNFDASPVQSADGELLWADVQIAYVLPGGLTPQVTIRVPIPWNEGDTFEERKAHALRCARQLIDHACRAAGVAAAERGIDNSSVGEAVDAVLPAALEGLAQELGLAAPSAKPRQQPKANV